jgi:hemolysin activation/secretion protein
MQLLYRVLCLLSCLWSFAAFAEEQTQSTHDHINAWGVAVTDQEASQVANKSDLFNIFEYVVNGNTVLPVTEVEKAVYSYLGEERSIDDVEKARSALETAFHKAGYLTVFVNIPEQEVNAGIVKLDVLEGKVEKLEVVGSKYHSLGKIKTRVAEFKEGNVPHFPTVQKQIASVNTNQDRTVAPVLRPGKTPGMVEVDLKVDDKLPVHAGLEYNNRYNPNTTATRLSGNLRYDNLWQLDHSLSLGFQVTPEDVNQTKVFTGTYVIPYEGDYYATYAVVSKSDVSAVGDVSVVGNGNLYGFRYIHPLPNVDNYYHNLTLGIDYKDFQQTTKILGADALNAPIQYTPLVIGYTGNFNTPTSTTKLDLNLNFSLRGFGNHENQFKQKRFDSTANYAYIRSELAHTQRVFQDWQLYGSLGGQFTKDSLISNEQYFLGGLQTVRGYLEANALGDYGINAKLELRTPETHPGFLPWVSSVRGMAFYDYGYAKIHDPLPSQTEAFYLASTGFGLQLKAPRGIFAQLDFAHVLRTVQYVDKGHERLLFRVGFDW